MSTDKAVNPVNAMGMSKALMEKVVVGSAYNNENCFTKICITRYGNVMGSRGSAIPLFINQIKSDKPITVTDPEMTRFMMSLDEAVELVLFAFNNCSHGDIFIQKSSAATIDTLVSALKEIFNAKNEISIMGTRHGEKKHEVLLNRQELFVSEDLGRYYKIPIDKRSLNYEIYFEKGAKPLSDEIEYTSKNTKRLDKNELIQLLLKLDIIKSELDG